MVVRYVIQMSLLVALVYTSGGCGDWQRTSVEREPEVVSRFPIVEGEYRLTETWSATLPEKFQSRMKDRTLVLWRDGLTIYVVGWGNEKNETATERLDWVKKKTSPEAFDVQEIEEDGILRFAYRLREDRDEGPLHSLYGFAFGGSGHVQLAFYSDVKSELDTARQIWLSLREHPTQTN